jgi:predicted acyltransferase
MAASPKERVAALDVIRGAAVAGMIVVTSPGDWSAGYPFLMHADWHGWTVTDMIFPAFLFAVGMALGLTFPRDLSNADSRRQFWWRVARRTALLILLGLLLNALTTAAVPGIPVYVGKPGLAFVRIPGILQRIALCYAAAAVLIVATRRNADDGKSDVNSRAILLAIAVILVAYWLAMRFVPVPGYGAGRLDPEGNLASWLDRTLITVPHMLLFGSADPGGPVVYDPEGLLSTLPALTNVLCGVLVGNAWRRSGDSILPKVAVAGALLIAAGLLLDPLFPINKKIWTSSFALLSSGFSCLALVPLAIALRSRSFEALATPLRILGVNAILAFSLWQVLAKFGGAPWFHLNGETVTPQAWGNAVALSLIPDPRLASLACALGILAGIALLLWPLERRAIHLRV